MPLPVEALERLLKMDVELELKDGRILRGKLLGYDTYLNLVLEGVVESEGERERRLGTVVVRGTHVTSIASPFG